jgi:hypothetical protein
MNKLILLFIISASLSIHADAQSWDQNDEYYDNNRNSNQQGNQGWGQHPQGGWNNGNQNCNNPYQDPNYYPSNYGNRGCPPPPPPSCRRNVVVVTPPPSYCAPVVIVPRPYPYFRPYGYNPYRRPYGYGYRPRGWRYR